MKRRGGLRDSVRMPVDSDKLPSDVATLRAMLASRATGLTPQRSEFAAARAGLLEQRYEIAALRSRLARALRVAFGRSSENCAAMWSSLS